MSCSVTLSKSLHSPVSDSLPRLLRRFSFPLCDCLGTFQLPRKNGQPLSDETQARHSCPSFWAETTHNSPHPWGRRVSRRVLALLGYRGLGWGLCSCRRKATCDGSTRALGPTDFTRSLWHRLEQGIFNDRV